MYWVLELVFMNYYMRLGPLLQLRAMPKVLEQFIEQLVQLRRILPYYRTWYVGVV